MNLDRRTFTAMLAGTVARCGAALRLRPRRRHEVGVLFGRRTGAQPLRGRSGCRDPDQARLGEDGRHHSVRVAASVAQISLRHREQRRPGRIGRRRTLSRRLHDLAERRARAPWRRRQAQVPADPFERRQRRRIRAGRLQFSLRNHRAQDQGRRHHRRHRRPARQPRDRHLFPPGPHLAAEQDRAGGRARQQSGGRQGRGSGLAARLRVQERRALEPAQDPAERRLRLRPAPPRLPPDPALGLSLDRAAEPAHRLQDDAGGRPRHRAAVHQGDARRSRAQASCAGCRDGPRPPQRPLHLPGQPLRRDDQHRTGDRGRRRQEGVHRRREQHRRVGDQPADRRADGSCSTPTSMPRIPAPSRSTPPRRCWWRDRSRRRRGARTARSSIFRRGSRCSASVPTASSTSCASTTSMPASCRNGGPGWSRLPERSSAALLPRRGVLAALGAFAVGCGAAGAVSCPSLGSSPGLADAADPPDRAVSAGRWHRPDLAPARRAHRRCQRLDHRRREPRRRARQYRPQRGGEGRARRLHHRHRAGGQSRHQSHALCEDAVRSVEGACADQLGDIAGAHRRRRGELAVSRARRSRRGRQGEVRNR